MMKYYEQKQSKTEGSSGKIINKHIFLHQYEHNAKALVIWSLVVGLLMGLVTLLYPVFKDFYAEMIATMPQGFQDIMTAIGGGFTNITEFYAVEGGQVYVLVGVIYAVMLASSLIKNEMMDGSYEYIYSQPVSRTKIFRTKLLVLISNLIVFNIIVGSLGLLGIHFAEGLAGIDIVNFILYTLFAMVIHLQIGIIVFSLTAVLGKKMPTGALIGIAVLTYFIGLISLLSSMEASLEVLKYFTPFTYVLNGLIIDGFTAINIPTFIGWSIVSFICLVISYIRFKRQDII